MDADKQHEKDGISFLVAADTHYGQEQWASNEDGNKATIAAMNAIADQQLPVAGWGKVGRPAGVIVVGDLTDSGKRGNWQGYWFFGHRDGFSDDYPVRGGSGDRIRWPVYEGYGNHDIHNTRRPEWLPGRVAERNRRRAMPVSTSQNGLHYSWDWCGVHFLNINIYPGRTPDARGSLDFLRSDLADAVGESGRPVVICQHYGFDQLSRDWWTAAERAEFHQAISGYNIAAIFCGHWHAPEPCMIEFKGIPSFVPGRAGKGRFFAIRIRGDEMLVAGRNGDGWSRHWLIDLTQE